MNKGVWILWPAALAASLLAVPFLVACSSSEGNKVAGGTEAESTLAFHVQRSDGSVAPYARVRVLPENYLSDGSALAQWKESDGNGFVEIAVEPGDYMLEARHVDGTAATGAVRQFAFGGKDSGSRVDTVKLGALSSIEGFVLLGDSAPVVRIAGLDRYVLPDSTGHFVIDSLPAGNFDVQFGDPQESRSATVEAVAGDTLYVDCSDSSINVVKPEKSASSEYPGMDWSAHETLLAEIEGYAVGTLGAAGVTDSLGNITRAEGEICIVTTTEDYRIVEDTSEVDSAGNAKTTAVVAPGSLRDCAYREGPTWVLFEKSGTYNLQSPLRLKNDKTIDGRGRDIRIAGMGVLTDVSSNLIFENLTFTAPAITVLDTSSRRALSIHNRTHHVWVDHCTFEEYPLVELLRESGQQLTVHHNYFVGLSNFGIRVHGGELHVYNNFFKDVKAAGFECTDSARCYVESNVFDVSTLVSLYGLFDEDGAPIDTTVGFVKMSANLVVEGDGEFANDSQISKPDYRYTLDDADALLAGRIRDNSGPR